MDHVVADTRGRAVAACPDYFNVEMRELNSTQRHNLCQLTEGKVVLVVNTASYCGYRGQFRDLETLYQTYKEKGLVVLGFPPTTSGRRRGGGQDSLGLPTRLRGDLPHVQPDRRARADASPLYRGWPRRRAKRRAGTFTNT